MEWLTEDDLIQRAAVDVGARQMRRWREAGLLPYRRESFGYRGGVRAYYPDTAVSQLREIVRLRSFRLNLDHIALTLWLLGYEIYDDYETPGRAAVRRVLGTYVDDFTARVDRIVEQGQLSTKVRAKIQKSERRNRYGDPLVKALCTAVDPYARPALLEAAIRLGAGLPVGDRDELIHAIQRIMPDEPGSAPSGSIDAELILLCTSLHPEMLKRAADTAIDNELDQVRGSLDPYFRALRDDPLGESVSIRDVALVIAVALSARLSGMTNA